MSILVRETLQMGTSTMCMCQFLEYMLKLSNCHTIPQVLIKL